MEKKPEETKDETIIDEEETQATKLVAELREAGAPDSLIAGFVAESEGLFWCYLTAHAVTERLLDEGIIQKMDASKIEGQLCQLIYMKMQVSVARPGPHITMPTPVIFDPPDPSRR